MKRSKRYRQVLAGVDRNAFFSLEEGIQKVKTAATTKFDESMEVSVNLGVNPQHADQMVRGAVSLPHGTGKSVRVLVLTKGVVEEAQAAGAEWAGFEEYVKKIQDGWMEFDVVVATPEVMGEVGKLGRILGPRGLMPNPKSGTVTTEVGKTVREVKAGKIEFRTDKYGILHVSVGKVSFEGAKLQENIIAFLKMVQKLRPSVAKGQYIKNITLSSTMGPGVKIDRGGALALLK